MAPTRTAKIPDSDWSRYKSAILSLYLSADIPLEEIIHRLRIEHAFSITISQLEAQLKIWKARRRLKSEEWQAIFKTIDSLPENTHSRVVLNGRPIPESRIERARRNCRAKPSSNSERANTTNDILDTVVEVRCEDGTRIRLTEIKPADFTPISAEPNIRGPKAPEANIIYDSASVVEAQQHTGQDHVLTTSLPDPIYDDSVILDDPMPAEIDTDVTGDWTIDSSDLTVVAEGTLLPPGGFFLYSHRPGSPFSLDKPFKWLGDLSFNHLFKNLSLAPTSHDNCITTHQGVRLEANGHQTSQGCMH
ncbi:uncharacterized protein F4822DRAFT_279505 [Hypoxylon trugodes]|uniref:uncharacterized protein n=1 Tax=Hypoxylon trugodes TaxID=326681 RepID=UPI00219BC31D|nr:uncharacterized protein F4822DRAFT_279505 [Hypoxylon trugodes]KAI1387331.1 hypothetical protein F4822DRAFT_279505 [Hypoxylon trugodes]